jgi:uncharacterized membrane-anchored protein YhcB (DUF1043 family)
MQKDHVQLVSNNCQTNVQQVSEQCQTNVTNMSHKYQKSVKHMLKTCPNIISKLSDQSRKVSNTNVKHMSNNV